MSMNVCTERSRVAVFTLENTDLVGALQPSKSCKQADREGSFSVYHREEECRANYYGRCSPIHCRWSPQTLCQMKDCPGFYDTCS